MLFCEKRLEGYVLCLEGDQGPGAIPVRLSLFPEYDLEAARHATHMVLDSTLPEVVYLGSEAHTRLALARCLERGKGFMIEAVKGLGP
jgi:hypothetical protein